MSGPQNQTIWCTTKNNGQLQTYCINSRGFVIGEWTIYISSKPANKWASEIEAASWSDQLPAPRPSRGVSGFFSRCPSSYSSCEADHIHDLNKSVLVIIRTFSPTGTHNAFFCNDTVLQAVYSCPGTSGKRVFAAGDHTTSCANWRWDDLLEMLMYLQRMKRWTDWGACALFACIFCYSLWTLGGTVLNCLQYNLGPWLLIFVNFALHFPCFTQWCSSRDSSLCLETSRDSIFESRSLSRSWTVESWLHHWLYMYGIECPLT